MDDQFVLHARLQEEIDKELSKRVSVHKSNISRLKAARISAKNLTAPVVNRPLVMLAQGDSWFDYPLDGNFPSLQGTDVIAQLRHLGAMPPTILNMAVHGLTAIGEMSLKPQTKMIEQLHDAANWIDSKPDAILFSAGGNDIAGDEFCIFLNFNDGSSNGLNSERLAGVLASVRACYLDLLAVRDRNAPGVPVFSHCYDFPVPNGASAWLGAFRFGPWLKPSLDFCNWSVADGTGIVREALIQFRTMLKSLEANPQNNFHVIETQGTLRPQDWANELHPTPEGFKAIAQKFATALDRVLRPTFGTSPPPPSIRVSRAPPANAQKSRRKPAAKRESRQDQPHGA